MLTLLMLEEELSGRPSLSKCASAKFAVSVALRSSSLSCRSLRTSEGSSRSTNCFSRSSIDTSLPLSRIRAKRSEGRLPSLLTPSRNVLQRCSFVGPNVSSKWSMKDFHVSVVAAPNMYPLIVGPMLTPITLSRNANFCFGSVISSRAYAASILCTQMCTLFLSNAGSSGRLRRFDCVDVA